MLVSLQSHKEIYNVIGDNRIAIEVCYMLYKKYLKYFFLIDKN